MTAMSKNDLHVWFHPRRKPGPAFARTRAFIILVWQALGESRDMARAAHRRFPFAEW